MAEHYVFDAQLTLIEDIEECNRRLQDAFHYAHCRSSEHCVSFVFTYHDGVKIELTTDDALEKVKFTSPALNTSPALK